MQRARTIALMCAATFLVGGCASDVPQRDELADALMRSGLTEEVASCTADALVDNLSDSELEELAVRGPGAAPVDDPDREDDAADALRLAMDECRALQAQVTPPTTTSTTVTSSTASTTIPATDGEELRPAPSAGSGTEG